MTSLPEEKLCLLLFVGTWDRKLSRGEGGKRRKRNEFTHHGNTYTYIQGSRLIDYDARGRPFTVNSYGGGFCKYAFYPQVAAEQVYVGSSSRSVCFATRGAPVRSESCVLRSRGANG